MEMLPGHSRSGDEREVTFDEILLRLTCTDKVVIRKAEKTRAD
ncbi:MAG: hypothetical protein ACLR6B_08555 [Blautia sp.]